MRIGYARISSSEVDRAEQSAQLQAAGIEPGLIFLDEGRMGHRAADRRGLGKVLAVAQSGDVVVSTSHSRVARSIRDFYETLERLHRRGVALEIGGHHYDPTEPVSGSVVELVATFAEYELELARADGPRSRAVTAAELEQIRDLAEAGELSDREIADSLGLHPRTIARHLRAARQT